MVLRGEEWVLGEQACFHVQQAAEKALKGVCVAIGVAFPRAHDLRQLLDMLTASGMKVPRKVQRAEVLTPYAVQTRYPADLPEIEDDELNEAQAAAEATLAWAEKQIVRPLRHVSPGRRAANQPKA